MDSKRAFDLIKLHATDPHGINSLFRNGSVPEVSDLQELSDALDHVYQSTFLNDSVPRDVAFGCGTFLQFRSDYYEVLKFSNCEQDTLFRLLLDINLKAYNVLAGKNAPD